MRATFRDRRLQRRFARDGFVVIPGYLRPAQVRRLVEAYESLGPAPDDPQTGCHFDYQSAAPTYKALTNEVVREVMGPGVESWFDDYRPYYGNFIMKWPGAQSGFGVHQDTTFVDESRFRSASIWCSTVDTSDRNGSVWFVPGSHRLVDVPRAPNRPISPFDEVSDQLRTRYAREVRVGAGDAIVFDHAVVHFSYPNVSPKPRLATALGVIPEEALLRHHHFHEDGSVEIFEVDAAFFVDHDPYGVLRSPPRDLPVVDRIDAAVQPLTLADLDGALRRRRSIRLPRRRRETGAAVATDGPRSTPGPQIPLRPGQ